MKCTNLIEFSLQIIMQINNLLKQESNVVLENDFVITNKESQLQKAVNSIENSMELPSNKLLLGCINSMVSLFVKLMEINTEEVVLNIVKTKEIRSMNFVQILCEILANSLDEQISIKITKLVGLILINWTNGFDC